MGKDSRKIHWLWPVLCPELALFGSAESARAALRTANARYFRLPRLWIIIGVLVTISIGIGIFLPLCVASRIGVYLTIGLWNVIPTAVLLHFSRVKVRRSIRQQLVEQGVAVCLECGYPLQGLPEPRCPECGAMNPPMSKDQR